MQPRILQHMHICSWPRPPLPASLSTVLLDLRLCLSFLRRRHVLQSPHPPHCTGPVPAAAHHRTASLVLPQVNSPTPRKDSPASPHTLPGASLTGCEPVSGAELRVTNASSFSHWGGALSGSTGSWLPLMLNEKRTGSLAVAADRDWQQKNTANSAPYLD